MENDMSKKYGTKKGKEKKIPKSELIGGKFYLYKSIEDDGIYYNEYDLEQDGIVVWRRERDSNPRYGCPHT